MPRIHLLLFPAALLKILDEPDETFTSNPLPSLMTACAIVGTTFIPDRVYLTVLHNKIEECAKRFGIPRHLWWLKLVLQQLELRVVEKAFIDPAMAGTKWHLASFPESATALLQSLKTQGDILGEPDPRPAFYFILGLLRESEIPDEKIRPLMEVVRKTAQRLSIKDDEDTDLTLEMLHCSTQAHKKHLDEHVRDADVAARKAMARRPLPRL